MSPQNRYLGDFPRNRLLRARILAALNELGRLDVVELAILGYGGRLGRRRSSKTESQWRIAATRRALRSLIERGKVAPAGPLSATPAFLSASARRGLALA
jgi:hypothetical protein